jgi:hypothetical protein
LVIVSLATRPMREDHVTSFIDVSQQAEQP